MIEEERFVAVLGKKEKAERKEERAATIKTSASERKMLKDAIHNFLAALLREIRKPVLEVCKVLDTAIEDFDRGVK